MSLPRKAANDPNFHALTISRLIRKCIFLFAGILSLLALSLSALPWVASTRLVRDRIAIELGSWSGFRVAISSPPEIQVWPVFRAILTGVTLHPWGKWDNPALLEIERLEIDLSALAALSGNVAFIRTHMINPVIRIPSRKKPGKDALTFSGRITEAIDATRHMLDNHHSPIKTIDYSKFTFGSLECSNGRLLFADDRTGKNLITELSGLISWPSLNASANLALKGVWNNRKISLLLHSERPLVLLAGGKDTVELRLESQMFKSNFVGNLALRKEGLIDGKIGLSIPSVQEALLWSQTPLTTGMAFRSISSSGALSGKHESFQFQGNININEDISTGIVDVNFLERTPRIEGKLSFATLNIQNFLSVFSPLMSNDPVSSETPLTKANFNLDLSVAKGKINPLEFSNITGKVLIQNKLAEFNISEATGFGGMLRSTLKIDNRKKPGSMHINLEAHHIDGAVLGKALSLQGLLPASKGNISGVFRSTGIPLDKMMSGAEGVFTAHFGKGNLYAPNLIDFLAKTQRNGFFPLSEITSQWIPVDSVDLSLSINRGIGRIRKAQLKSGDHTLMLSGVMPYQGRSLALSGSLYSREKVNTLNPGGKELGFFVGGSWDAPFVSFSY